MFSVFCIEIQLPLIQCPLLTLLVLAYYPHPYPGLTSTRGMEKCSCFACTTLLGLKQMISTCLSSEVHPQWLLGPSPPM